MPAILVRAAATAGVLVLVSGFGAPLSAQDHRQAMAHPHRSLTPLHPGTAADTAQALAVVHQLRSAISPYQTLSAAAAAGYHPRRDSATVRPGKLLHVGRRVRGLDRRSHFDAAAPKSLLFRRTADGSMRLAGAMFVAPPGATAEDLDAMIPLSVAQWHQHLDVCVARANGRRLVLRSVRTAEACEAAGGRFRAESRYMIHVITDAGDDVAKAFPS
jgi:hypothetical protein